MVRLRNAWRLLLNLSGWLLAFLWRTLMFRTTFILITGSLGKTTAKECLAVILATVGPTAKTHRNQNDRYGVPHTLLAVRPWHKFAVIETATGAPGAMARASLLLRPDVALILKVARMHTRELGTLEDVAREKAQALRFLRRRGIAVLNGSDERVAAMARLFSGRVITFGVSGDHDLVARDVQSSWPDRLEFTVEAGERRQRVKTQLVGAHLANSVLGAIAAASACGVDLEVAGQAVGAVAPFAGRMQPVQLPSGAVMIRDSFNGSIDSFEQAIEVLRAATVSRRILVMTDCSDYRKKPHQRLKYYAQVASEVAEMVVFIGDRGAYGAQRAIRAGMGEDSVHACFSIQQAVELLRRELRTGDLVLIRGMAKDHLARLYFSLLGTVECTLSSCRIRRPCDECSKLGFEPDPQLVELAPCAE